MALLQWGLKRVDSGEWLTPEATTHKRHEEARVFSTYDRAERFRDFSLEADKTEWTVEVIPFAPRPSI